MRSSIAPPSDERPQRLHRSSRAASVRRRSDRCSRSVGDLLLAPHSPLADRARRKLRRGVAIVASIRLVVPLPCSRGRRVASVLARGIDRQLAMSASERREQRIAASVEALAESRAERSRRRIPREHRSRSSERPISRALAVIAGPSSSGGRADRERDDRRVVTGWIRGADAVSSRPSRAADTPDLIGLGQVGGGRSLGTGRSSAGESCTEGRRRPRCNHPQCEGRWASSRWRDHRRLRRHRRRRFDACLEGTVSAAYRRSPERSAHGAGRHGAVVSSTS